MTLLEEEWGDSGFEGIHGVFNFCEPFQDFNNQRANPSKITTCMFQDIVPMSIILNWHHGFSIIGLCEPKLTRSIVKEPLVNKMLTLFAYKWNPTSP